jgi:hypothetical protein
MRRRLRKLTLLLRRSLLLHRAPGGSIDLGAEFWEIQTYTTGCLLLDATPEMDSRQAETMEDTS